MGIYVGKNLLCKFIRRKLLEDHKYLYRIKNDDEVEMMLKDVITYLNDINEYDEKDADDIENLRDFKEVSKAMPSYDVALWVYYQ